MNIVSKAIKRIVNESEMKHIDDIETLVDEKIANTSADEWLYCMKQGIRSVIQSYWEEELQKSKDPNYGRGYAYVGKGGGITNNYNVKALDRQTKEVLDSLGFNL